MQLSGASRCIQVFEVNFVLSFDLEDNILEYQIGKKREREM